ncbi:unnamed protein product [Prorocentrum cordatum]|uniref:Uncharacterized protein n=1 Tax=Prorocentrum cordatum TaxID=2364126 RepID=A0ABN9XAZ7_9DINO|nr:unnamed protein product [Polarella glacialis]
MGLRRKDEADEHTIMMALKTFHPPRGAKNTRQAVARRPCPGRARERPAALPRLAPPEARVASSPHRLRLSGRSGGGGARGEEQEGAEWVPIRGGTPTRRLRTRRSHALRDLGAHLLHELQCGLVLLLLHVALNVL